MEIKFFIKKLLDFYIRFTDEFSIEIELNAFEEYKKEFSLIKKDFNKLSFDKEKFGKEIFDIHNFDKEKFDEENLIIDVNLMLQKIEYIFCQHFILHYISFYSIFWFYYFCIIIFKYLIIHNINKVIYLY